MHADCAEHYDFAGEEVNQSTEASQVSSRKAHFLGFELVMCRKKLAVSDYFEFNPVSDECSVCLEGFCELAHAVVVKLFAHYFRHVLLRVMHTHVQVQWF